MEKKHDIHNYSATMKVFYQCGGYFSVDTTPDFIGRKLYWEREMKFIIILQL
jgi:hypothetical protein